jgi:hypothetical protein
MTKFDFARIHSWCIPFSVSRLPGVFLLSSRERCKWKSGMPLISDYPQKTRDYDGFDKESGKLGSFGEAKHEGPGMVERVGERHGLAVE